jgi:hypothetical protein
MSRLTSSKPTSQGKGQEAMSRKVELVSDSRPARKSVDPHDLDQGWLVGITDLGDGMVRTPWGRYGKLEVQIAAAAEMSPRVLVQKYTVLLIEALGLKEQVLQRIGV